MMKVHYSGAVSILNIIATDTVNLIVVGYIMSNMTQGLNLPQSLMLEPSFIANAVDHTGNRFTIVRGFKWKVIYYIFKMLPERLVAKLP